MKKSKNSNHELLPSQIPKSHCFNIQLATKYGLFESIMIHFFEQYLSVFQKNPRLDECLRYFSYWNKKQINSVLKKLTEKGFNNYKIEVEK